MHSNFLSKSLYKRIYIRKVLHQFWPNLNKSQNLPDRLTLGAALLSPKAGAGDLGSPLAVF